MRVICVVVGSRANYSSIKSVLEAIRGHPTLTLKLVLGASATIAKYGNVAELIKDDGFTVDAFFSPLIEGSSGVSMAKSTGLATIDLSSIFERLSPDIVVTVGDRFETMATVIASAYMNIPIAHTMGGEVSGTLDESIRHAITKFSHIHFPASQDASTRIVKLGEVPEQVHMTGCPRIDLVHRILSEKIDLSLIQDYLINHGTGDENFDVTTKPFIVLSQHPVTTEWQSAMEDFNQTLLALSTLDCQKIVLWPNADSGSESISKAIRVHRENFGNDQMRFYTNLPIRIYVQLMATTSCLVGNSSSGIRECAFIGTPVVNIGSRQKGREKGKNVLSVPNESNSILSAIREQIAHGKYEREHIYGSGDAGLKIANVLASCSWSIQKRITY